MNNLPPILLHELVDSTNDLAQQAARQGAPHASCWVADQQLAGRGRRELSGERRAWFSPPGANLYLSLLLRGPFDPTSAATLTLAAAVAAHATIAPLLVDPSPLWIKWPNDLYLDEKKLGGILCEGVLLGAQLDAVIIGVGLNVNLQAHDLPQDLQPIATSLAIASPSPRTFDRLTLAQSLRHELLKSSSLLLSHGLAPILERWRPHDRGVGRRVELLHQQRQIQATSRGIASDGSLRVALDDGTSLHVQAGEVRFLSLTPPSTKKLKNDKDTPRHDPPPA